MKILEIANVDFSLRHFLFPLMKALKEQGHEVVGACAEGPLLEDVRKNGFRVEPIAFERSYSPLLQMKAFWQVLKLIRREKPDIVHAHMPISGLLARFAAALLGVPVVAYTCHGFLFNQPGSRLRQIVAFLLEWLAGQVTDRYFTVSREEADQARKWLIHPQAVAIGNGRDPNVFYPSAARRKSIRKTLGVNESCPVILIVSRLVPHKGYRELLIAMEKVDNAILWVVGSRLDSDHGENLEEFFQERQLKLGKRLQFLGYRTDIPALMAAADIFVLPSYFEGLPMVIIEAMLCGLPVVATDIKGSRELVQHGQTGLLVPPTNIDKLAFSLRYLSNDLEKCKDMGKNSLSFSRINYNELDIINKTVRELLGKN